MCFTTFRTFNTANGQHKRTFMGFHLATVVTVNIEAAGVPTGTGKLMELKAVYTGIIKILRQRIVFFD